MDRTRIKFLTSVLRLGFALALAGAYALAQTSYGRISGTITDRSGAPVPGARVVITNTETQLTRVVQSETTGFYVAANLPIGVYSVAVDHSGFKRESRTGLELASDARITEDFTLQLGDVSESVEVVGAAVEMLNTVSGELSRVIDSRQVDNLALNGRNAITCSL